MRFGIKSNCHINRIVISGISITFCIGVKSLPINSIAVNNKVSISIIADLESPGSMFIRKDISEVARKIAFTVISHIGQDKICGGSQCNTGNLNLKRWVICSIRLKGHYSVIISMNFRTEKDR